MHTHAAQKPTHNIQPHIHAHLPCGHQYHDDCLGKGEQLDPRVQVLREVAPVYLVHPVVRLRGSEKHDNIMNFWNRPAISIAGFLPLASELSGPNM